MGQILSLVVETGDAVSDAVSDRSFRNAVVLITGAGSGEPDLISSIRAISGSHQS